MRKSGTSKGPLLKAKIVALLTKEMDKDVNRFIKKNGIEGRGQFVRDAIREKLGKVG